jgi:hypothetical protein
VGREALNWVLWLLWAGDDGGVCAERELQPPLGELSRSGGVVAGGLAHWGGVLARLGRGEAVSQGELLGCAGGGVR